MIYFDDFKYNLLGERSYNDDSLLTDSMVVAEAQFDGAEKHSPTDLNSTQISEQVVDFNTALRTEDTADSNVVVGNKSPNFSLDDFTIKSGTSVINSNMKKTKRSAKK